MSLAQADDPQTRAANKQGLHPCVWGWSAIEQQITDLEDGSAIDEESLDGSVFSPSALTGVSVPDLTAY